MFLGDNKDADRHRGEAAGDVKNGVGSFDADVRKRSHNLARLFAIFQSYFTAAGDLRGADVDGEGTGFEFARFSFDPLDHQPSQFGFDGRD